MLIATSTYHKPLSEIDPHRPTHLAFIKTLVDKNLILMAGRQDPATGAVIVVDMDSIDEFQQIIKDDPFVQHGLASYDVIKFTPVVCAEYIKEKLTSAC